MPYIVLDQALAEPAGAVTSGAPLTSEGLTLAELRAELKAMLGNRTDVTPERLDLWLNLAYLDVASSVQLEEMKGGYGLLTVAGQPLYVLPSAVGSTIGASIVDATVNSTNGGRPLEKSDLNEYRRYGVSTGAPLKYMRQGQLMVFYPTPDRAYTINVDFRIRPGKLVADTDSPILPPEWTEAILLNARQKAFAALMEFDKSAAATNDFIQLVRRKEDTASAEDENKVIGSSVPRRHGSLIRKGRRFIEPGDCDGVR